jgi:hypothetical protein
MGRRRHRAKDIESRFASYVEGLVSADRAGPLRDYCVGLMMFPYATEQGIFGGDSHLWSRDEHDWYS